MYEARIQGPVSPMRSIDASLEVQAHGFGSAVGETEAKDSSLEITSSHAQ
jgi:hypothetical protein